MQCVGILQARVGVGGRFFVWEAVTRIPPLWHQGCILLVLPWQTSTGHTQGAFTLCIPLCSCSPPQRLASPSLLVESGGTTTRAQGGHRGHRRHHQTKPTPFGQHPIFLTWLNEKCSLQQITPDCLAKADLRKMFPATSLPNPTQKCLLCKCGNRTIILKFCLQKSICN